MKGRKLDLPHGLLDLLMARMHLRRDADLCRFLGVPPPVISKIRGRKMGMSGAVLLRIMERGGISFDEVRKAMDNPKGDLCVR